MSNAVAEYEKLIAKLSNIEGVTVGQMFGKPCIKVQGKAFLAQHKETVVFKLTGEHHQHALAHNGAVLWDPSGKLRPMKEWVAIPASENQHFSALSEAALAYVASTI